MRRWTHVWSEAEPKCAKDRTGPGTGLCDGHQASVAPVGIARIIMLSVFSCYSAVKVSTIIDIISIIKICPAGRPLHLRRTRHLCGSNKTNPSRERFHNDDDDDDGGDDDGGGDDDDGGDDDGVDDDDGGDDDDDNYGDDDGIDEYDDDVVDRLGTFDK